jgi:hypothetical protein
MSLVLLAVDPEVYTEQVLDPDTEMLLPEHYLLIRRKSADGKLAGFEAMVPVSDTMPEWGGGMAVMLALAPRMLSLLRRLSHPEICVTAARLGLLDEWAEILKAAEEKIIPVWSEETDLDSGDPHPENEPAPE